jgi:hypothetical protein
MGLYINWVIEGGTVINNYGIENGVFCRMKGKCDGGKTGFNKLR